MILVESVEEKFYQKTQDAFFLRKEQFSLQKETFPVIQKKVQMSE